MNQEQQWIRAAQQGDSAAFEQLLLLYQQKIYHLALRTCGDPHDAEESTQEAFLSAWKNLPSFRGESSFSTWLYRLTVNACNDLFRKNKASAANVALEDEEAALQVPDTAPGPEESLQRKETQRAVQDALQQLSDEHRQVLLLRELQQLSYDEIAAVLDMDLGTVKSRIHRARNQLREILLKTGTFSAELPSKGTER